MKLSVNSLNPPFFYLISLLKLTFFLEVQLKRKQLFKVPLKGPFTTVAIVVRPERLSGDRQQASNQSCFFGSVPNPVLMESVFWFLCQCGVVFHQKWGEQHPYELLHI